MAENDSEALRAARLSLDFITDAERAVNDDHRSNQEFNLWIVGLSSSAIGLFAVMDKYSRLSGRYVLAAFVCFVLAIVVAVIHRWISSRAIWAHRLECMTAKWDLMQAIANGEEKRLQEVTNEQHGSFLAGDSNSDIWSNRIRMWSAVFFVLGISIFTAALVLNLALGLAQ